MHSHSDGIEGYRLRRHPLPEIATVSAGQFLFVASDRKAWPLVDIGEFAIIDPTRVHPDDEDLLLIDYGTGPRLVLARMTRDHWYVRRAWEVGGFSEVDAWRERRKLVQPREAYMSTCDGPCSPAWFDHYSRGRVVGIYIGPREEDAT